MSEQEQQQGVESPEPEEVEEEGSEPGEEEPAGEAAEEGQLEEQAGQPSASAEQEAAYRQLDTKADNYFKGLSKIAKDVGLPLVPCELCANAYPGVRWTEPQDDPTRAMLGIIGATESGSPLLDDPDAEICDRCDGFGWTKLPAHVPGNTERMCKKCNGAGWLDRNPQSGSLQPPVPEPVNGPTEPMPGVPADDPSVVDLRARGFTVIPPLAIGTPGGTGE